MKKLLVGWVLCVIVAPLLGCYINDNASTAMIHSSDNRLAAERAQAQAQAQIAAEQTQQQLILNASISERLYAQQNYLVVKQAEGTNRLLIVLGFALVLVVMVGGAWLFLFVRMNPQPTAHQYPQLEYLDPVPLALLSSQRAINAGWQIAEDEFGTTIGERNKGPITQRVYLLEDNYEK